MNNETFKIIMFFDTWQIENVKTKNIVLSGSLPYNRSISFDKFLHRAISCHEIKEVFDLYEEYVNYKH